MNTLIPINGMKTIFLPFFSPLPIVTALSVSKAVYLHGVLKKKLKDRTNYPLIISFLFFKRLMFKTFLADLIMIPAVIFIVARFSHKRKEPEWVELNRFRAYLRTPEFMKRRDKLFETYQKGGDNHD